MSLPKYGRYEALHLIASGGMASVYLGRTVGAGGFERLVALKVMHEHISHDPSFRSMFLDEARLAARIRHPNVVPTLDVTDDGRLIVMEYVEGAALNAILKRLKAEGKTLPVPVALRIFLDALAGLHAAHELCDRDDSPLKIVHRDVSPHNILVGVDGTSRITDFGIAYAEARITSTRGGQLKGKLPYMAPEQLEDKGIDRRTDVYAAGCVLWEMLTGRRLFKGSSEAAMACAVLAGPEHTVCDIKPEVPPLIDEVCMRALKHQERRYATALEFAETLEQAADASGIRIARHREVGPTAQATALTFPPISLLTACADKAKASSGATAPQGSVAQAVEPEPPTVPAAHLAPAAGGHRPADPATAEQDGAAEPSDDKPLRPSATLVTPSDEPPASMPPHARTTTEDRPPPEVAAVIRAAQERLSSESAEVQLERASERDQETDASLVASVVLPVRSHRTTALVAAVVAVAFVAIIVWVMSSTASSDDDARTAASASADQAGPEPTVGANRSTAEATSGATPHRAASASVSAPPTKSAPLPHSTTRGRLPPPRTSQPKPPPPPEPSGYHPDQP